MGFRLDHGRPTLPWLLLGRPHGLGDEDVVVVVVLDRRRRFPQE